MEVCDLCEKETESREPCMDYNCFNDLFGDLVQFEIYSIIYYACPECFAIVKPHFQEIFTETTDYKIGAAIALAQAHEAGMSRLDLEDLIPSIAKFIAQDELDTLMAYIRDYELVED